MRKERWGRSDSTRSQSRPKGDPTILDKQTRYRLGAAQRRPYAHRKLAHAVPRPIPAVYTAVRREVVALEEKCASSGTSRRSRHVTL